MDRPGVVVNLQATQRHFANLRHRFLLSLMVALLLGSTAVRAQRIGVTYDSRLRPTRHWLRLSPASQAVLARLSKLDRFPMGDLRCYAGNLQNRGAIVLDDSS